MRYLTQRTQRKTKIAVKKQKTKELDTDKDGLITNDK